MASLVDWLGLGPPFRWHCALCTCVTLNCYTVYDTLRVRAMTQDWLQVVIYRIEWEIRPGSII